jgi:hypothetical protein
MEAVLWKFHGFYSSLHQVSLITADKQENADSLEVMTPRRNEVVM